MDEAAGSLSSCLATIQGTDGSVLMSEKGAPATKSLMSDIHNQRSLWSGTKLQWKT